MKARVRRAAGVLALVLVSACAGIPRSGPVTKVADDAGFGESTVRYSPARPVAGAAPQEIVSGYLDAMLAYPASTGTASAFLTPAAAKDWGSQDGVRIYSRPLADAPRRSKERSGEGAAAAGNAVEVRLSFLEDSYLDQQGHFTRAGVESVIDYRLQQVKGQWRIANPQDGLLITKKFFDDYFRPFDIFFFDRPGRRLVPDPVHLSVGDQLATALVTSLVRGPRPLGDATARTYVPSLRALRPAVTIDDDGVADVQFNDVFGAMSESAQDHLSAQIVWTLRQVPEITAVRLMGGTSPLSKDGSGVQKIDSWGAYGPSLARGHAYAIADNSVLELDGDAVAPLSGTWGKDALGATSIAVDSDAVAGVLSGGSRVRVTDRKGTSARTFKGSRLIAPRWDADGVLWLVDRGGDRTRVRVLDGTTVRTIDSGGLFGLDVEVFALSPEGAHYVVTVRTGSGSAMYAGSIVRDAKDRILGLGGPVRVPTTARAPRSAMWASATELTFLAESASGVQVYTASIDGSSTSGGAARGGALLPVADAGAMVIGTGEAPSRYATDARRRLWLLSPGGTWRLLDRSGVTGLTMGR